MERFFGGFQVSLSTDREAIENRSHVMSAVITKVDEKEKNSEQVALPNSRRIYIGGKHSGVRVPFREIEQNPTRNFDGTLEDNLAVRVYDTSGPWGDPSVRCDLREGLPGLRREWIIGRGDTEEYEGREL